MKKFKKLHKGMSLVEIIVAMSMFSICTTAVVIAFKAAVDYNTKNQRRDDELAVQLNELQDGTSEGVELYNNYNKDHELVFTVNGSASPIAFPYKDPLMAGSPVEPYKGISEYQAARSGKNDTVYDFQLKTFSKSEMAGNQVIYNRADGKFKLEFVNETDEPLDVYIYLNEGEIYLGDYDSDGYKHLSDLYTHSLAPTASPEIDVSDPSNPGAVIQHKPSAFEVGFKDTTLTETSDSPLKMVFMKDGFINSYHDLSAANIMNDGTGYVKVTAKKVSGNMNINIDYDPS